MTDDYTANDRPRTIGEALQYCAGQLEASDVFFGHGTDNAWDEAVQLVLGVADLPLDSGEGVMPHPLDDAGFATLDAMLRRRVENHEPLPYILGRAWFAGLEFLCDRRAIIPRSPIAELILHGFKPWYGGPQPQRLLDMCCGGGCIGLAAAHYWPQLTVDLVDLDENALALATDNVKLLGLEQRCSIVRSNLFDELTPQCYDLIVSNPPYVNREDLAAMPAEYHHEPALALGSGPDGLALTRQILQRAAGFLSPDGLLIVEVGNSWEDLEKHYPQLPFTWLEFEHGGHGVLAITAKELQQYSTSFTG